MVPSRRRYPWFVVAFSGIALVVLGLLFVRARIAAERAASDARLRVYLADQESEHQRLRAQLEEVKQRAPSTLELVNERRDGSLLCERVRCNEGDRAPIWDTKRRKLERDPYDDWAREPRLRR